MASQRELLSSEELERLLVQVLVGVVGEDEDHWSARLGGVEKLPVVADPACNWRVHPVGSHDDLEAVEAIVEIVRGVHPYVI